MAASIREFTSSNLLDPYLGDGFVFGILRHSNTTAGDLELDMVRNAELVMLAKQVGLNYSKR
ncbi:hypothetical protein N0V88_001266 [Collariella sp. IMI 366227]|nr:hypothetical protein N0V88_001266 [Collariella sp. IMI 366227]